MQNCTLKYIEKRVGFNDFCRKNHVKTTLMHALKHGDVHTLGEVQVQYVLKPIFTASVPTD